jgi:hypothetical protein
MQKVDDIAICFLDVKECWTEPAKSSTIAIRCSPEQIWAMWTNSWVRRHLHCYNSWVGREYILDFTKDEAGLADKTKAKISVAASFLFGLALYEKTTKLYKYCLGKL